MIKTFKKADIEETYFNMVKAIHDRLTANIILKGEKLKAFPQDQEQEKDAYSHHFYSTKCWKS